jgi:hypothetical protein
MALQACLDRLSESTLTEACHVVIERTWHDGPDAFIVVYKPPLDQGRTVGLRRIRSDTRPPNSPWHLGDMSPSPYIDDYRNPDPVAFGKTVADFDIGEPLGAIVDILRTDDDGVGWWGTLGSDLPRQ